MSAPLAPCSYPISLQDAVTGETLVLAARDGNADIPVAIQKLSTPGPDVRESMDPRPNADGEDDQTLFHGSRAVTIALTVLPRPDAHLIADQLYPWVVPSRRSYLIVQRNGWPSPRRMLIRGDQFGEPVTGPGPWVQLLLPWKAAEGVWESVQEFSATIFPSGTASNALVLPFTLPITLGSGSPPGARVLTVAGTVPTPPTIRLYGPVTGPVLTNQTVGTSIAFRPTYAIPAGEYVEIAYRPQFSVKANGDGVSRLGSVDWSASDPWLLQPGDNQLSLAGSGISAVTQAVVFYRERRI